MTRILPVKFDSSYKSLWFDAKDIEVCKGSFVVVTTARGVEFGAAAENPFEATKEQLNSLKSPLKPVLRVATEADIARAQELKDKGIEAMPAFREIVETEQLDMRPVSVEYLFDGDKAVFYFESDERVDFRDLVRKLAARFHVRIDMRQIGVRDEARLVGGLGHCGQELCCKRLGGEFCPVSIRMAKEQDLSLNPQKISGVCGRLMCCLRYEYDAYKDFKSRSPKVGGTIETPDGSAKVTALDVPREVVTVQVAGDKKIKVPLEDFHKSSDKVARPDAIDDEAWERATTKEELSLFGDTVFITSQFTGTDKLGNAVAVHRETSKKQKSGASRQESRIKRGGSRKSRSEADQPEMQTTRRARRRSTTLANGVAVTTEAEPTVNDNVQNEPVSAQGLAAGGARRSNAADASGQTGEPSRRRRRHRGGGSKQGAEAAQAGERKQDETRAQEKRGDQQRGDQQRSSRQRGGRQRDARQQDAAQRDARQQEAAQRDARPGRRSSALRSRAIPTDSAAVKPVNTMNAQLKQGGAQGSAQAGPQDGAQAGENKQRRRRRRRRPAGGGGEAGAGAQGASAQPNAPRNGMGE